MAEAPTSTLPRTPTPPDDAPVPAEAAAGLERLAEPEQAVAGRETPEPPETSSAVVPVAPPRHAEEEPRPGFWRRLAMRRRERQLADLGIEGAGRLRALEDRVGDLDRHLDDRIDALEGQLTQFWAIDERLGKLEELATSVDELHKTQVELVRRLERNGRALRLLAIFAVLAAVAALGLVVN